ncbi:unnamed protein product [Toxocara canis]|uniref:ER membrane protein complex subunit 6 n=1 Tax=Toxocara canis TaxID=6265 RepID=A0A183UC90_TOXCA|nr:unnamed protein product [Toxocara canis]
MRTAMQSLLDFALLAAIVHFSYAHSVQALPYASPTYDRIASMMGVRTKALRSSDSESKRMVQHYFSLMNDLAERGANVMLLSQALFENEMTERAHYWIALIIYTSFVAYFYNRVISIRGSAVFFENVDNIWYMISEKAPSSELIGV